MKKKRSRSGEEEEGATTLKPVAKKVRRAASIPTLATRSFPELANGDCLAFALASARHLALTEDEEPLHDDPRAVGTAFRAEVEEHIHEHWRQACKSAGGILYGDLVAMVHNQALPNFERDQYPDWGDSLDDKLAGWLRERNQLYWGQAEISAFVDLMAQHGQRFRVRVWREFRPRGSARHLQCLCTTPDADSVEDDAITIDLRHKGALDGPTSHYALMRSGHLDDARV